MKIQNKKSCWFFSILGFTFAVGTFLRLYMLSSQILLDDEWHSIIFIIGKTYLNVLTQFNPADNSSPLLNIYNLFLYHNCEWSEFTIRLPVILVGLLNLIILPLFIRYVLNERVAIIFAIFIAVSPFLIFYSRFARSYGLMMLLCFSALILSYQWLTSGNKRYALGYVVTSVVAVYAHMFSIIAVLMPIVTTLGIWLFKHYNKLSALNSQITISCQTLLKVTLLIIAFIMPLLFTVIVNSSQLPWQKGEFTVNGFMTIPTLLFGTMNYAINVILIFLCVVGCIFLIKNKSLLCGIFLTTIFAYFLVLLVSQPQGINSGMVMLRYMIVVVPIALTMVAIAIDELYLRIQNRWKIHPVISFIAIFIIAGFFFVMGPLPDIYATPNNFTNHSAFEGSYMPYHWECSDARSVYPAYSIMQDQIPQFYHWLRKQSNIKSIIEYPFDICDYNDLFYYYQYFHKKNVIAGYCINPKLLGYTSYRDSDPYINASFTVGILSADQILSSVDDPKKLLFHNMIDITDVKNMTGSQADIIVLHKYVMALRILPDHTDSIPVYYNSVTFFNSQFREIFGPPVYEDMQIICYHIKPVKNREPDTAQ